MRIVILKPGSIVDIVQALPALTVSLQALPRREISWVLERRSSEILRDNPLLDRLIEVVTKALRRGLVSGETLRAPRQQLRQLRASAFDLILDFQGLLKSASIARLSGALRILGSSQHSLREAIRHFCCPGRFRLSINSDVIQKTGYLFLPDYESDRLECLSY